MLEIDGEVQKCFAVMRDKAIAKVQAQISRLGTGIPFMPYEGKYIDCMMPDGLSWWTNGFWPGILWQLYSATGDALFSEAAEAVEKRLAEALYQFEKLHHDVGFMFLPTSAANYSVTGSKESYVRAMHAASLLAGRFNPTGEFIRAWNESIWAEDVSGWVIIDSMMNIPLLYWASAESRDPRFADIANRHARTALKTLIRPDSSVNHIVSFDPTTGAFLGEVEGQGYGIGSSWSRGQAWAVYGFALTYAHTGCNEYLDTAKAVAHYCISSLCTNDWLPAVDFRSPDEPEKIDSSAAAIIACGLLEIAEHVPVLEKRLYLEAAIRMLCTIEKKYANWDESTDGILFGSSMMYHDDRLSNTSFIYGDYFFIEAILRLNGQGLRIWGGALVG